MRDVVVLKFHAADATLAERAPDAPAPLPARAAAPGNSSAPVATPSDLTGATTRARGSDAEPDTQPLFHVHNLFSEGGRPGDDASTIALGLDATLDGFSRDTFVSCTAGGFARCDYCEEQVRKKRRRESDVAGSPDKPPDSGTSGGRGHDIAGSSSGGGAAESPQERDMRMRTPLPGLRFPTRTRLADDLDMTPPSGPPTRTTTARMDNAVSGNAGGSGGDIITSPLTQSQRAALPPTSVVTASATPAAGRGSSGGPASSSGPPASTVPAVFESARYMLADDRALAAYALTLETLQRGQRAALAVWRSYDQGDYKPPCSWCRALSVPVTPGMKHTSSSCFNRVCMNCLRPSIMRQSARTATMGDVCCQPRNICKEDPKPWDPNTDGHIDPSISRCDGCCLPRTVRCDDETAHDMHGAAHFGPTKCPWTLCIKVVLIQVLLSRAHMSVDKPDFAPALFKACQVEWTTTSGNGSDAAPERLIPNDLLVWGPNKRQQGTDAIARWLTSGRKLPNIVLLAPILARAFDLSF
ncbi:hypothetical protein I4F81_005272 [Pyropia yezoensis]|uniref:Uncharacterized protein n=1 Tax=Pyropia yezoensis TaxID=2788 RepID=A0ACC3BXU1_PYRYE|nr:hypothetical protein I4F81_005272 [Neopyropia yezoensis]